LTKRPEKLITEGKGVNIEKVLGTATQSVTAILTLILLLKQI
jgi:hypothetical protein